MKHENDLLKRGTREAKTLRFCIAFKDKTCGTLSIWF